RVVEGRAEVDGAARVGAVVAEHLAWDGAGRAAQAMALAGEGVLAARELAGAGRGAVEEDDRRAAQVRDLGGAPARQGSAVVGRDVHGAGRAARAAAVAGVAQIAAPAAARVGAAARVAGARVGAARADAGARAQAARDAVAPLATGGAQAQRNAEREESS